MAMKRFDKISDCELILRLRKLLKYRRSSLKKKGRNWERGPTLLWVIYVTICIYITRLVRLSSQSYSRPLSRTYMHKIKMPNEQAIFISASHANCFVPICAKLYNVAARVRLYIFICSLITLFASLCFNLSEINDISNLYGCYLLLLNWLMLYTNLSKSPLELTRFEILSNSYLDLGTVRHVFSWYIPIFFFSSFFR